MNSLARQDNTSGDMLSEDVGRKNYEPKYRKPWYQDIIEWFLSNPGGSVADCAKYLHKTPAYIAQLLRSDMMKAHMAKARRERLALINEEITLRAGKTLMTSLDLLDQKYREMPLEKVKMQDLNETSSNLLNALGFAPKSVGSSPNMAMQLNISVGSEMLVNARAKMEAAQIADTLTEGEDMMYSPVTSGLHEAKPDDLLDDLFVNAPAEGGPGTDGEPPAIAPVVHMGEEK